MNRIHPRSSAFSALCLALVLSTSLPALVAAQAQGPVANRAVYLDSSGVVRWRDNRQEVTLFGANYVLPTASDYRAAGYLRADRKRMIDEDMAQFARLGWDGLRLTFWGDWEASDRAGNLIANDHLDLQDYLIAKAREGSTCCSVQSSSTAPTGPTRSPTRPRRASDAISARGRWAPIRQPSQRR